MLTRSKLCSTTNNTNPDLLIRFNSAPQWPLFRNAEFAAFQALRDQKCLDLELSQLSSILILILYAAYKA